MRKPAEIILYNAYIHLASRVESFDIGDNQAALILINLKRLIGADTLEKHYRNLANQAEVDYKEAYFTVRRLARKEG